MICSNRQTGGAGGRSIGPVVAVCLVVLAVPAAADDDVPRWSGHLQWGFEYDGNPHRVENPEVGGDLLARYFIGGDILTDIGASGQVEAAARHGGTRFRRESRADTLLTGAEATGTWRPGDRVYVQVVADVKDRTEAERRRDYSRGGAAIRLGSTIGSLQPRIGAGARFFAFKPAPESSHRGPRIEAGLGWAPRPRLAFDATLRRASRSFEARAWQLEDDRFVPLGDERRADTYDRLAVSGAYQRELSARLTYQYVRNRSNSYGQAMNRHALTASLTVPTVWDIFVSARGELQRTRYEDPVALDELFYVDEEHRNAVVLALTRPVVDPWEVEIRYSRYSQEFGIDGDYLRQTLGVAVGVNLEGD